MKHFSPKWKRELAEDAQANRLHVPFPKEPVKLIVGWMVGGGGNDLNTPDAFYPKHDLRKLEILKDVASHLEIKSLVEHFAKDILAWIPALPPVSIGSLVPKPIIEKPIAVEKLCWYCDKPGQVHTMATFLYSSNHDNQTYRKRLPRAQRRPRDQVTRRNIRDEVNDPS